VAQWQSEDVLADFAHRLRQPLSALEALTSYLELITTSEDVRVREHLRHMHSEISQADEILREGLLTLRPYFLGQERSGLSEAPSVAPRPEAVEELARPRTNAAMASVSY
jgi:signal transduction histidine kinase